MGSAEPSPNSAKKLDNPLERLAQMELLNSLSSGLVTVAALLAALAIILKFARSPILNWLRITTTPADVKGLLEEVSDKVDDVLKTMDELLELGSPPTEEELAEAMETMERAGFVLNYEPADVPEEPNGLTIP